MRIQLYNTARQRHPSPDVDKGARTLGSVFRSILCHEKAHDRQDGAGNNEGCPCPELLVSVDHVVM